MKNPKTKDACDTDICNSYCCRYISIHVGVPSRKTDFEVIKWYVAHKGISVYKDDTGQWIIHVEKDCKFQENNRCTDYAARPIACREYNPADCSLSLRNIETKALFETPEDVDRYMAKRWQKKKKQS